MMAAYVATSNKAIDPNLILGHLSFYTVGETKIDEKELEGLFVKNNLPTKFIRKISKADAFRRASSASKGSINITFNGVPTKAKLEIDEVRTDHDGIVRLMGRKVIDDQNTELSYEVLGRIDFDRHTNTVHTAIDPNKQHLLSEFPYDQVLDQMRNRFNEWSIYHTKDTIRNLTNNIINELYPVSIMPSGVAKFVPKTKQDHLYSLQGLVRDLSQFGTGNIFEIIPVIDTDEQRDLITRTANEDIKTEMNTMVKELKEIVTSKSKIPMRTATSYINRFKDLQGKVAEYEGLMGTYMQVLKSQIGVVIEYAEVNTDKDA